MVSTVFLMFIHLYYTLPSLEKAPLPPHCILSAPHRGCSTQRSQAACPGMWAGSVFTKTALFLGSGELIKTPRINSQQRALLHLLYLGRNKGCIFQVWGSLTQIPMFWSLVFLGISHRSLQLQTQVHCFSLAPPPGPSAGSLAFCLTLPCTELLWQQPGNRAALIIHTWRSFQFWDPVSGSSIFEASHFDFSPAASSKLTTKGWYRRKEINGRIVF